MNRRALAAILTMAALGLGACATGAPAPPEPVAPGLPPPTDPARLNVPMGPQATLDERRLILVTMDDAVHRRLTQRPMPPAGILPRAYAQLMDEWRTRFGIRRVADWPLASLEIRCLVFEVEADRSRDEVIADLMKTSEVETVQPLQRFESLTGEDYNDPYRKLQRSLDEMGIEAAHRWASGRGVQVAIVDTGLDSTHPELAGRIRLKRNLVDDRLDDFDHDVHGTAVAAALGAAANNALGLVGVAPRVDIMALKACWQSGERGERGGRADRAGSDAAACNSFTLAKALNVAIDQKADLINLSLGGPPDPLLERLVRRAIDENIVVVAAVDPRRPGGFAAGTPGVLGVGQTEWRLRNVAARTTLLAPGDKIISARPGSRYDVFSGSSLSTALVSGVAAMVRERKPHVPVQEIADLLTETSNPDTGSVSACRALARLAGDGPQACRPSGAH